MNQKKINVAVVDDDESFSCALERLFRASGFEVQRYVSAEAFLHATTVPRPACLVLDIHLGGMSGLELQQRLQASGDRTPIIFVTAQDAPAIYEEAERGSFLAFFVKPVRRELIIQAIMQATDQANSIEKKR